MRKLFVKTPSGRNKVVFKPNTPSLPRCPDTGQSLKGVPKARSFSLRRFNRSKKRVNRKFGGRLSSIASRRRIIELARKWLK